MLNDDRGAPAQTTESSRDFAPSKSKREDTAGDVQYTITSQQVNKPTSQQATTQGRSGWGRLWQLGKESSKERGCCLHVHLYASF